MQKITVSKSLFRLKEIPEPPTELFVAGDPAVLTRPSVAVVGTRRPSGYGIRSALHFSQCLSNAGLVVVSGLARGVDSAAHRGALRGASPTVAVLGHGLDCIYPPENWGLAQEIVDKGGALVTEYPPGAAPQKHHFPARNRIISGLSLGVLVIEAAESSGSLITARHALEQNREVFVLPNQFDDPGFRGNHHLIQSVAKLVTGLDDVLEELGGQWASEEPVKSHESPEWLGRLKTVSDHYQGVATLEELFSATPWVLGDLVAHLQRAEEQGAVATLGPQQFAWVRDESNYISSNKRPRGRSRLAKLEMITENSK